MASHRVLWQVGMRPGKRRALKKGNPIKALTDKVEQLKASAWTK